MKYTRGFTLLELLTYVSILALIIGTVTFFVMNIIRNEGEFADRVRMTDEADFAMRRIIDEVRASILIHTAPTSTFNAGGNSSVLALLQGPSTITFYAADAGGGRYELRMMDSVTSATAVLTSPRVSVDGFALTCVSNAGTCGDDPKAARITITLRDLDTQQTQTLVSGAMPRGF